MKLDLPFALLLGAFLLVSPEASGGEGPDAPDCGRSAEPEDAAANEAEHLFDAEDLERHTIRFDPKANGRPEGFWWASPNAYLRGVYAGCPQRSCCKFCLKGKPCGDSCIARWKNCIVGCGCACRRPLASEVPED